MNPLCKEARDRLRKSTRTEYEALVQEAKLTPLQTEILRRHILLDETICQVSESLHCSERRIKKQLHEAYMAVHQALH